MNVNQIKQITTDLLSDPITGWQKHRDDYSSEKEILTDFVIPFAGAAALAMILKALLFGGAIVGGVIIAAISLIFQILYIYLSAYIVRFMATKFDGNPSPLQVFRYVSFGGIPRWLGAIVSIVPYLGALISLLLSLYGIYIMYQGITPMADVPQTKRLPFFLITGAVLIITTFIITAVIASITLAVVGLPYAAA